MGENTGKQGEDIKIGYGRVKIKGVWKSQTEIEREGGKNKEKENNNNRK